MEHVRKIILKNHSCGTLSALGSIVWQARFTQHAIAASMFGRVKTGIGTLDEGLSAIVKIKTSNAY